MHCPRCQHENPSGQKFCGECANPLKGASPVTRSGANDLKAEVQSLRQALTEALDQQTATAEILQAISSSHTDTQPVFDAIVGSAVRLCDGFFSVLYSFDGERLQMRAANNLPPAARTMLDQRSTMPLALRASHISRVVQERRVVQIRDLQAEEKERGEEVRRITASIGNRSWVGVPMLREGEVIGAISVSRREVKPFTEREFGLLQTFANQAVIAIENVRLFTELQQKNRALAEAHANVTEALEQQTATSEILGVISSSPTDIQPVFDAIVRSAVKLCNGLFGAVFQFDGERLHLVAHHNLRRQLSMPFDACSHDDPIGAPSRAVRSSTARRFTCPTSSRTPRSGRRTLRRPPAPSATGASWSCRCSGNVSPSARSLCFANTRNDSATNKSPCSGPLRTRR